ncbi:MAG: hypothetical protein FWG21_06400, partial [Oscillospiraceae bacterium]|nr:hypothetical protein [Oscillospiraceae bacterium]
METATRKLNLEFVRSIISVRKPDSHKGSFGHLLATVGSYPYRGAAVIATLGAYYAGAGLVTVASTEEVISTVVTGVPEAIFLNPYTDRDLYKAKLKTADACLIGCG